MTSVDSGVETGNDSNDSYVTLDSQSTVQEVSPVKISTNQFAVNNFAMNKSPPPNEQASGSVDSKEDGNEATEFRSPSQKTTCREPIVVEPPAGLTFCNIQPSSLSRGNGYEVIDSMYPTGGWKMRSLRISRRKLRLALLPRPLDRRLRHAVSVNNVELVTTLLEDGVNPNCSDAQGRSPLHLASCRGYCDIVRLLLEKGANPNHRDSLGNTPLHLAACTNNVAVVTMLLKAGTNVSSIDHYGRSPLQLAQSKLKLLQRGVSNEDSKIVKQEVHQVIEMMLTYLHKRGQEIEAELLGAFSSRLTLSNTREEVETGVRDLLASLANLSLDKSGSEQVRSDKE